MSDPEEPRLGAETVASVIDRAIIRDRQRVKHAITEHLAAKMTWSRHELLKILNSVLNPPA